MSEVYRFSFQHEIPAKEIEEQLYWAVFNTESVYGKPTVRLDGSFLFDEKTKVCVIDKGTDVGRHIAQLFTSYLTSQFGEAAFKVQRIENPAEQNGEQGG